MGKMKSADIEYLRKQLLIWYTKEQRDLPWRRSKDPYRIWVSEVMLQQTKVNTVIPYYRRFLNRFPDIETLARSSQQDVLKIWEGLGYYARARNFHRAADAVLTEFNSRIPATWKEFCSLPGVGDYIGAAVLSIAFEQPYAVVDGNVKRVLARLFKISKPVNVSASLKTYQAVAAEILDPTRPGEYNQAVMELGALICKPRDPDCRQCPVGKVCQAYQTQTIDQYPQKIKKRPTPQYRIAVGVVFKNGRVLITRRKQDGLLGGLWEFPGGKIKSGETAEQACIREIKEEVNLSVAVDSHLTQVKHAYTHFKIVMDVYCCRYVSGRVRLSGPVDFHWVRIDEIDKFPIPKANHKFMPHLKQQFG